MRRSGAENGILRKHAKHECVKMFHVESNSSQVLRICNLLTVAPTATTFSVVVLYYDMPIGGMSLASIGT